MPGLIHSHPGPCAASRLDTPFIAHCVFDICSLRIISKWTSTKADNWILPPNQPSPVFSFQKTAPSFIGSSDIIPWGYPWLSLPFHSQSISTACWSYLQNMLQTWPFPPTRPLSLEFSPASLASPALIGAILKFPDTIIFQTQSLIPVTFLFPELQQFQNTCTKKFKSLQGLHDEALTSCPNLWFLLKFTLASLLSLEHNYIVLASGFGVWRVLCLEGCPLCLYLPPGSQFWSNPASSGSLSLIPLPEVAVPFSLLLYP